MVYGYVMEHYTTVKLNEWVYVYINSAGTQTILNERQKPLHVFYVGKL